MAGTKPGHDGNNANLSHPASNRALPPPILPFVYQEVRMLTLAARVALGCRGVSCCGFPLRRPHRGDPHLPEVNTQPGITRSHVCRGSRSVCGLKHLTSFAQWMVQDGSIGRCDRWGPKLT